MTREEAILLLHDMKDTYDEIHENTNGDIGYEQMTALDMAIEALRREEAEERGYCHRIIPSNVEVVVRCKDCKWYENRYGEVCHNPRYGDGHANYSPPYVDEDYWCKDGERREP